MRAFNGATMKKAHCFPYMYVQNITLFILEMLTIARMFANRSNNFPHYDFAFFFSISTSSNYSYVILYKCFFFLNRENCNQIYKTLLSN